jgi:uncharacterized protein YecT (DUF1311 family)
MKCVFRILVTSLFLIGTANSASFDCSNAVTAVDKAICVDAELSALDDRLAGAYKQALDQASKDTVTASQRAWIEARNRCVDKRCLRRSYERRIEELSRIAQGALADRSTAQNAAPARPQPRHPTGRAGEESSTEYVPFRSSAPIADMAPQPCFFSELQLEAEVKIFATGASRGRRLDWQMDQSGHSATQIDVAVNNPQQPVVLMLGAYEPTIWNIGWTKGTRIVAVLVSGYHRQALAGLDPKVPVINSSYDNRGPCGYFYLGSDSGSENLNPISRRLFGRPVDMIYPAGNGAAMVGERTNAQLLTHPARPPESFRDLKAPLAGRAGLEQGIHDGRLRPATPADGQAWAEVLAVSTLKHNAPPVAGVGEPGPRVPSMHRAYVVLKEFTFPAGLYGANSATFFVPKGVARPSGNPGHSAVYDFNTLSCSGALCGVGR